VGPLGFLRLVWRDREVPPLPGVVLFESSEPAAQEAQRDEAAEAAPAEEGAALTARAGREGPRSLTVPERASQRQWEQLWYVSRDELAEYSKLQAARPRRRGDCVNGPRPCPWVSCRHHLYIDATDGGGLKLNFPHLEPWELAESCSLDVADREGTTLEEVGVYMNLTRERVRQLEETGLASMRERTGFGEGTSVSGRSALSDRLKSQQGGT